MAENENWQKVKGPGVHLKSFETFVSMLHDVLKAEEEAAKAKIRMLSMMGVLGENDDSSK